MGFGSLEAALTTTADVAQIALAGGLGRAGAGLQELLMADFLSGFTKAQNKAAEMSVRCINSNVCKDPITKLLKMAILHLKLLLLLDWLLWKATNTLLIS
jgi:hypothetical protein